MGVFKRRDDFLDQDPLQHLGVTPPRPTLWVLPTGLPAAFGFGFLLVAVLAGGASLWQLRHGLNRGDDPYAYFEIKAIDPDGRAVAGATVSTGGEEVGITDSFGEWRRFVRVKLGTNMAMQLIKNSGSETLTALKTLAVPSQMPAAGELEVKGRVELSRSGQIVKAKSAERATSVSQ